MKRIEARSIEQAKAHALCIITSQIHRTYAHQLDKQKANAEQLAVAEGELATLCEERSAKRARANAYLTECFAAIEVKRSALDVEKAALVALQRSMI